MYLNQVKKKSDRSKLIKTTEPKLMVCSPLVTDMEINSLDFHHFTVAFRGLRGEK